MKLVSTSGVCRLDGLLTSQSIGHVEWFVSDWRGRAGNMYMSLIYATFFGKSHGPGNIIGDRRKLEPS